MSSSSIEHRVEALEGDIKHVYRYLTKVAVEDRPEVEERIERLERRIARIPLEEGYSPEERSVEEIIEAAIHNARVLCFDYVDREGEGSLRFLSPWEIKTAADGRELVIGWDHQREAIRHFRIDRISEHCGPVSAAGNWGYLYQHPYSQVD